MRTKVLGHKNSGVQKFWGTKSLRHKNFEAQKRKETELVFSRMFTGLAFELTQLKP